MDSTFLTGWAAFISSVLIFCGSVWLLLALVLGPRLSYLITASITLGFVLIMGLVWSYGTPLGPVGEQPRWNAVDIGPDAAALGFAPAAQYPNEPWAVADPEDVAQTTQAAELENAAGEYLEQAIDDKTVDGYENAADAQVAEDSVLLLQQGDETFGALTLEPVPDTAEGAGAGAQDPLDTRPDGEQEPAAQPVVVVMSYDPGNPSGPARLITAGTFLLFAAHLVGLSRAESRSKKNGAARA